MATEKKEPRPPTQVILSKPLALLRTPRARRILGVLLRAWVLVLNHSITDEHLEGKGDLSRSGLAKLRVQLGEQRFGESQ